MKIITRDSATPAQLQEIHEWVHAFIEAFHELLEVTEQAGVPVPQVIKGILGVGVQTGSLGKYEKLVIGEDGIITFDAWIMVEPGNPNTYYLVHVWLDTINKQAKVSED